jgi:rubrerythrin
MEKSSELGLKNRTGLAMSPRHARELLETLGAADAPPTAPDGQALAATRGAYIAEADPLGTLPAPATLRGVVKSGAKMAAGLRPQVFIDKLAERAAFERSGTRLYDGLLAKLAAEMRSSRNASANTDITEARVARIRDQEAQHFALVCECIETLGADPTTETPSADAIGVASTGLLQVVSDPRTSLTQSLQAVLAAELIDREGWELAITMADELGERDMITRFRDALKEEDEHLLSVRRWYVSLSLAASGAD